MSHWPCKCTLNADKIGWCTLYKFAFIKKPIINILGT